MKQWKNKSVKVNLVLWKDQQNWQTASKSDKEKKRVRHPACGYQRDNKGIIWTYLNLTDEMDTFLGKYKQRQHAQYKIGNLNSPINY